MKITKSAFLGQNSGKMLGNIGDRTKIILLEFMNQKAKSRANRGK